MAFTPIVAAGLVLRRQVARGAWCWLLLRATKRGEWGFPKGHIEPGESWWDGALRECAEETGIASVTREGDPLEVHYRLPSGADKVVVYFPARTQASRVVLSDEHSESRWCDAVQVNALLPQAQTRALFNALHNRISP